MLTSILILISLNCNLYIVQATFILVPKVVGGSPSDIRYYPHSAFILTIKHTGGYICGASILNQQVLLTAAHCIESPNKDSMVYTGHTNRKLGNKYRIAEVKVHERYNEHAVGDDIGLILVNKAITFGKLVQRVSITKWPPLEKRAAIAGWGLVSDDPERGTEILHHAELKVWTYEECRRFISSLPRGCICAGSLDGSRYASGGDSGSALIVSDYIQIGLVSYKRPNLKSIVAFTNVSYYYNWIKHNAQRLYCNSVDY